MQFFGSRRHGGNRGANVQILHITNFTPDELDASHPLFVDVVVVVVVRVEASKITHPPNTLAMKLNKCSM